jgi:hypothetical protein
VMRDMWARTSSSPGHSYGREGKTNPLIIIAYIHRLTKEYRVLYMSALTPHIFVGDVAPPMNIWGRSKSNWMALRFVGMVPPMNIWGQSKSNWTAHIFVGARPKPMNIHYIHWFRVLTNII